jgi:uncharacterized membrane protein YeaQ/YmgE (transglycosylase-associated protein family)
MSIIWAIIIGFIVGVIAKFIMPGKDPKGFIITTLLGIAGSFVGKFIGQGLGMYKPDQPAGFFMSVIGAIILLFIYHLIVKDKETTT